MASESPRSNWDGIVTPIIQVKLGEARVAQAKADEKAKLQKEREDRETLWAQQRKDSLEEAIAKRWGLLESLHARELLEGLNASQNIWRGLSTLEDRQYTQRYSDSQTSVEVSLMALYVTWGWKSETCWCQDGGLGERKVPAPVGAITYTKVGITPAGIIFKPRDEDKQIIRLQGMDYYLRGPKFFDGEVLYIIDSDADLEPIEGADTFNDGNLSLSRPKNRSAYEIYMEEEYGGGSLSTEHLRDNGVFLIEAAHSQALEILTEVLKRSCICRARGNLLPFQLKEKGDQIRQQEGLDIKSTKKPKGFWGRLFG